MRQFVLIPLLILGCEGPQLGPRTLGALSSSSLRNRNRGAARPRDYGAEVLGRALDQAAAVNEEIPILTISDPGAENTLASAGASLDPRPESFAIVAPSGRLAIIGRDVVGAMYGALELAERLHASGRAALELTDTINGAPAVAVRAANLFLVIPAAGETDWWFLSQDFWQQYLDLLARSRINLLDMHAMYNMDNTIFPNALLYFGTSSTYPDVGVPIPERERNLAMLNYIIGEARARGIGVGLMTYKSDTSVTGDAVTPPFDDDGLKLYTREAAADIARRASGLERLGFRIGESGHSASWYIDGFVHGVLDDAATGVKIYTRTWGSNKPDILRVVDAGGPDTIIQAKYNGEQLAAPYVIAGGAMARRWSIYSYENYLNPPAPYPFVFQVRAGGTHRIFRYAAYERTRRAALSFGISRFAAGFTLEAAHAYYPQPDFYHADPADSFSPWTFRRDELSYLLFGRLAYDPTTPESVFRLALADRVGTDALWNAVQAASDIVPWIQTGHTCGPDHRDFAPELELGGPVGYWAGPANAPRPPHSCGGSNQHQPFDTFAIALPFEAADDLVHSRATSRLSPLEVARIVLDDAARARAAADVAIDPANAEARDVVRECLALADLGEYFAHKLRGASALAVYAATAASDYLAAARAETTVADDAWRALSGDTGYLNPFREHLRMRPLGIEPFHWRAEIPRLDEDPQSIDQIEASVVMSPPTFKGTLPAAGDWLATPRPGGPGLLALDVAPPDPTAPAWTVTASFAAAVPEGATVNILWKPFKATSGVDWRSVPATPAGGSYQAVIAPAPSDRGEGALFAVEVVADPGAGWRYPDLLAETPYRVLAP